MGEKKTRSLFILRNRARGREEIGSQESRGESGIPGNEAEQERKLVRTVDNDDDTKSGRDNDKACWHV